MPSFIPEQEPDNSADPAEIARWSGRVSATGARSQLLGAIIGIVMLIVTVGLLMFGLSSLKSADEQLGLLSNQLKTLNEQQTTFLDQQKIMADQLKVLNKQNRIFLARLKPRFSIDGYVKLDCENPDNNDLYIRIVNITTNPAKTVFLCFGVLMGKKISFEDLISFKLKDFAPNGIEELKKKDIVERFNTRVRDRNVKGLTKKGAIIAVNVYLTYTDDVGTEYNDKDLEQLTSLPLTYY